jgi:hypothetical protein
MCRASKSSSNNWQTTMAAPVGLDTANPCIAVLNRTCDIFKVCCGPSFMCGTPINAFKCRTAYYKMLFSRCLRYTLCSMTYGGGHPSKRNTVLSLQQLPRHHPAYDNVEKDAVHISLSRELIAVTHRHLDAFESQGVRSCGVFVGSCSCRTAPVTGLRF